MSNKSEIQHARFDIIERFAGCRDVKRKIETFRKEIIYALSLEARFYCTISQRLRYYSLADGAKTIRIPATPLLRILLRLFPEQPTFLAIVQFLISLGEIQELQDPLAAIDRRELPGRVPVNVQRPDVTPKFH